MIQKKICVLGAAGVGKTSLTAQFVFSKFSEKYLSSMGVKIDKKVVDVEGSNVNLMIWDIHGEEKYKKIPLSYLRGASGIMLVIDGTRLSTLKVAYEIIDRVSAELGDIPHIYLINKSDLKDAWSFKAKDIEALEATGHPVFLTSAKTGEHVNNAFLNIASKMLKT